jgi:hypothetical protein
VKAGGDFRLAATLEFLAVVDDPPPAWADPL